MLRLALAAGAALQPLARPLLRRRLALGKEDPQRWQEKLGQASQPRPEGTLIWLHSVGLGEAMALRGLIAHLGEQRPDWSFLITSSARSSAEVVKRNLPPRSQHQFLPLDMPGPVRAFLDHWRPDLALWSEQDLWPRLVVESHKRQIPQMMINARMGARARKARARFGTAYADLLSRLSPLLAQDGPTAENLRHFAPGAQITVTGSLKPGAMPLAIDEVALNAAQSALAGRPLWLAAPTHPEDEAVALPAHQTWLERNPNGLLILAPRDPGRGAQIAETCESSGLSPVLRSGGDLPDPKANVWIADSFGELGLWYRLAPVALIGGSFGPVQGHNPWEAAALDCAILHGPKTRNFTDDYQLLSDSALMVGSTTDLSEALLRGDHAARATRARKVQREAAKSVPRTAAFVLDRLS